MLLDRPPLRVSYDADRDRLVLVAAGEAYNAPLPDELEIIGWSGDEDEDDAEPRVVRVTRGPDGPLVAYVVYDALNWDVAALPDHDELWTTPRLDVPSLALRAASIPLVVMASWRSLSATGSTPDVLAFHNAVSAGARGDKDAAATWWHMALMAGELTAHYGLGYTLLDLGRADEALEHLRYATELMPRDAWSWCYRGRAAQETGDLDEARRCFAHAHELEALLDEEDRTDAAERLDAL